jgi:zinc D-Ala-D-Ala dipeptidase
MMAAHSRTALVEVTPERHGVLVELAYAGERNFTGRRIYGSGRAWVHRDLEPCLKRAAELAVLAGFRLKVLDAYRTPEAHEVLCGFISDPRYVADPKRGSNHSRGTAVDVTLTDGAGLELDMGTPFDAMEEASHHGAAGLPCACHRHRFLLLGIMAQAGFRSLDEEWWHYQLPEARSYPLLQALDPEDDAER